LCEVLFPIESCTLTCVADITQTLVEQTAIGNLISAHL